MLRLDGKVAIVTGAGSLGPGIGNGRAAAILFAREGASVFLVDKSQEAVEETLDKIKDKKNRTSAYQADLTDESACSQMVARCLEVYGRVDILHNNIGGGYASKNIVATTKADWNQAVALNLNSVIFCSKAAIPTMQRQGGGAIINVASYAGLRHTSMLAYATTKAAVIHLTKLMAVDHGSDNIRVNCIAPGYIDTPMASRTADPEIKRHRAEAAPLNRLGTAWDVAWAAVYLASDEAGFVSGAVIPVDGGRSCRGHSSAYLKAD